MADHPDSKEPNRMADDSEDDQDASYAPDFDPHRQFQLQQRRSADLLRAARRHHEAIRPRVIVQKRKLLERARAADGVWLGFHPWQGDYSVFSEDRPDAGGHLVLLPRAAGLAELYAAIHEVFQLPVGLLRCLVLFRYTGGPQPRCEALPDGPSLREMGLRDFETLVYAVLPCPDLGRGEDLGADYFKRGSSANHGKDGDDSDADDYDGGDDDGDDDLDDAQMEVLDPKEFKTLLMARFVRHARSQGMPDELTRKVLQQVLARASAANVPNREVPLLIQQVLSDGSLAQLMTDDNGDEEDNSSLKHPSGNGEDTQILRAAFESRARREARAEAASSDNQQPPGLIDLKTVYPVQTLGLARFLETRREKLAASQIQPIEESILGITPFLQAIQTNDIDTLRRLVAAAESSGALPQMLMERDCSGDSLFHYASRKASAETLQFLVSLFRGDTAAVARAVNAENFSGVTPLFEIAAHPSQTEAARNTRLLLELGANPKHKSCGGDLPQQQMIVKGHLAALRVLLEGVRRPHSDDVQQHDDGSAVSPPVAAEVVKTEMEKLQREAAPLSLAVQLGNTEAVRLLLEFGADPQVEQDRLQHHGPFALAIETKQPAILELLLSPGNAQAQAERRRVAANTCLEVSPMMLMCLLGLAAASGDVECVRTLLASKACPDGPGGGVMPPLLQAASCGVSEVFEVLLTAGARADIQGAAGDDALVMAVDAGNLELTKRCVQLGLRERPSHPLAHLALKAGSLEVLQYLLSSSTANPNLRPPEDPIPPLLFAISIQAPLPFVNALLRARANPNLSHGHQPWLLPLGQCLAASLENGGIEDAERVQLLLQHRANPGAVCDPQGLRPLHLAVAAGAARTANLLLLARADPRARSKDGHTALELAQQLRVPNLGLLQRVFASVETRLQQQAQQAQQQRQGKPGGGGGPVQK